MEIGQNMKHIGAQTTFVNKITKVLMNFLKQNFFGKRIRTGTYFTSIINDKKVILTKVI